MDDMDDEVVLHPKRLLIFQRCCQGLQLERIFGREVVNIHNIIPRSVYNTTPKSYPLQRL